ALLQDQNRFLLKTNNEIRVRRLTRLIVLEKAKVMSYKDLKEAQAKREVKDKAIISKGKYSRKRKSSTPEEEVKASLSVPKDKMARMSEVEPVKAVGVPWRTPVAKIY
ncbi:hypothetical protein K469DRAFT_570164, partial [Zopfia rhizophila CBS 207.26]